MNYYIYENVSDFSCGYLSKREPFNMICRHYHAAYELLFMLGGVRYAFFNNCMHRLASGDIAVIKPYSLHFTENRESDYFERYVINFSDKALKTILSETECKELLTELHSGVFHLDGDDFSAVKKIFEQLFGHKQNSSLSSKKTAAKLITLIDILSSRKSTETQSYNSDIVGSEQLIDSINYINQHFTESISLDFIVNYSHMSKANFCRCFKKETGNTFLQYINNMRVAYAHNMLMETNMPIGRIAEMAGFSSVLHFDRVFKSIHSVPPSAIRKSTT